MLFGLDATDPGTMLAAFAFVAEYLPARRAARLDPEEALQYE